ncbi:MULTISPECIES: alpha/beta hydrolase [unclassified Nocardia]|uniref:alpha/beta hydrolase n=1 Tax=unclassified Nocardia TaxID=2637762 RepID=UPI001CE3E102|nr:MULTISPECIES: alpha/beta hydrolase [unclassified Nocardia]
MRSVGAHKMRLLAALGCGALVAGCTVAQGGTRGEPDLGKYYSQRVEWGSCIGFGITSELDPRMQCGRVRVPIDYDKPEGNTAQIAVSRMAVLGERAESLVVIPGVPGQPGLEWSATFGRSGLGAKFNVVSYDRRGLGASTPLVRCSSKERLEADRLHLLTDMSPSGIERSEQDNRDYVADCVAKSGTELLGHLGTREAVRDLDIIRAALGADKLNAFGLAYGSRVGSSYAERFPQHVRAMVLDASLDPAARILDPVETNASLQSAFQTYADGCVRESDCPLGADSAAATDRFRQLINPLLDHPAATRDSRGLNYLDGLSAVLNSLYDRGLLPKVTAGLRELAGGNGDTLLELADMFRNGDIIDRSVQQATLCLDEPRTMDRAKAAEEFKAGFEAAPITDTGRFQGRAPLDICAFWPAQPTSQPHKVSGIDGLPKVVVIATTGDPKAPYQGGVNLARALHASLITNDGHTHRAFLTGVDCVDKQVIAYFEQLTAPGDITCRKSG